MFEHHPKVSEEEYLQILENKFDPTPAVIKFEEAAWSIASDQLMGYMGEHYILKVNFMMNGNKQEESFFVKVRPTKDMFGKLLSVINIYEKEITFYSNIQKEFQEMGFMMEFSPKCYYIKEDKMIFLENMLNSDYKMLKKQFFDVDHCMVVMKSLAMLHANSFALENTKAIRIDDEFPDIKEEILFTDIELPGRQFVEGGRNSILSLSKLLPESEEWKNTFRKKLTKYDVKEEFLKPLPFRKCLIHGDLWSNNLLFKYEYGKPVSCCLVDYQLIRYYYPSYDVILSMYLNSRKEFREKHLEELLDYYYDSFEGILKGYGYDASAILSRADFLEAIEKCKALAFIQTVAQETFNLLKKEYLPNSKSNEIIELLLDSGGARTLAVATFFEKNEAFRDVMIEYIHELFDLL